MIVTDILNGAKLITLPCAKDDRGLFIKTYNETAFVHAGMDFELQESYFSTSRKDVIRGMHFQMPSHHHSKIVFCPVGAVLDVIMDLRLGSPTYGRCAAHELSAANHKACFIPEGFAHGFKSLADDSMTYYLVSTGYSKDHDAGIRYDSIDFDWEISRPIISERDLSFGTLKDFKSPFVY